jgi:hypothetical protein
MKTQNVGVDVDIVIYGVLSRYCFLEYEFLEVLRLQLYPSIFNCNFFCWY